MFNFIIYKNMINTERDSIVTRTQIQEQLYIQDILLANSSDLMKFLEDKLTPILLKTPELDGDLQGAVELVPLADSIKNNNDRIRVRNDFLKSIIDRIQL